VQQQIKFDPSSTSALLQMMRCATKAHQSPLEKAHVKEAYDKILENSWFGLTKKIARNVRAKIH